MSDYMICFDVSDEKFERGYTWTWYVNVNGRSRRIRTGVFRNKVKIKKRMEKVNDAKSNSK